MEKAGLRRRQQSVNSVFPRPLRCRGLRQSFTQALLRLFGVFLFTMKEDDPRSAEFVAIRPRRNSRITRHGKAFGVA
jgi:hypothetical protein